MRADGCFPLSPDWPEGGGSSVAGGPPGIAFTVHWTECGRSNERSSTNIEASMPAVYPETTISWRAGGDVDGLQNRRPGVGWLFGKTPCSRQSAGKPATAGRQRCPGRPSGPSTSACCRRQVRGRRASCNVNSPIDSPRSPDVVDEGRFGGRSVLPIVVRRGESLRQCDVGDLGAPAYPTIYRRGVGKAKTDTSG